MIPIIKREFFEIVGNRRYMFSVAFQTLAIISLLPFFTGFLAQGNLAFPTPALTSFVPVYVEDEHNILLPSLKSDKRLFITEPEKAACTVRVHTGEKILVEIEPLKGIKQGLCTSICREHATKLQETLREKKLKEEGIPASGIIQIKREFTRKTTVVKGKKEYSSFFLGYLLPLVLLFPAFFSGALVMHSIVGEKDKKTLEALITAPLAREKIVYAKFVAIWLFLTAQTGVWILLIRLVSIPVEHPFISLVLLSGIIALTTSLAIVQALLSENSKEASISMMILYIAFFIAIVVSLSLEYFIDSPVLSFIPFNLLSRLVAGEKFCIPCFFASSLLLSMLCGAFLWIGGRLIKRDDIVFGGRASLGVILSEAMDGYFEIFSEKKLTGGMLFVLLVSPVVFLLAVLAEVALAFLVLFLLGMGWHSLVILILSFALIEELLKAFPLLPLKFRGWLDFKSAITLGIASGSAFFFVESLLFALFLFPGFLGLIKLLFLRSLSTLLIHTIGGALSALWIFTGRKRYIVAASLIHALFNLTLMEVVI